MAATRFLSLMYIWLFLVYFTTNEVSKPQNNMLQTSGEIFDGFYVDFSIFNMEIEFSVLFLYYRTVMTKKVTRCCGLFLVQRANVKWSKHGLTSLVIPGHDPPTDITIFVDIETNPGPLHQNECSDFLNIRGLSSNLHGELSYTRSQLLDIRSDYGRNLSSSLLHSLKINDILRYRGKRGGNRRIPVRISSRNNLNSFNYYTHHRSLQNTNKHTTANLITVPLDTSVEKCLSKSLKFCLLNTRSVRNKSLITKDFVVDNEIDILAITETWLRSENDEICIGNLCPTGYELFHVPRDFSEGGGVGLMFKETLRLHHKSQIEKFRSFEFTDSFLTGIRNVRIIVVYRPPPSQANMLSTKLFFQEFSSFLELVVTCPSHLVIVGDFNFHVNDVDDSLAKRFLCLLDSFNLKQSVSEPTHRNGHSLDLVITRSDDQIVSSVNVVNPEISDHSAILFNLSLQKPRFLQKKISYRKISTLDYNSFRTDLQNSPLISTYNELDLNTLVKFYDNNLRSVLNSHAPLKHQTLTIRPKASWYNKNIDEQKRLRRRLERKWRKSKLDSDRKIYKDQCLLVGKLMQETKTNYYTNLIKDGSSDSKFLYKTVNKLLHKNKITKYPTSYCKTTLANSFITFFTDKIQKIHDDILAEQSQVVSEFELDTDQCQSELSIFKLLNTDDVVSLLKQTKTKSCDLDPLPAVVLNNSLDILLPVITRIINLSLEKGLMPDTLKMAMLTPLLKKSNADHEDFNNFRPISNLKFISKIIEKAVAAQLKEHMATNNVHEYFQSAYKAFHSTETALLRVQNDVLQAIDKNRSVILVLLDLSAAFDTVDHAILLSRLSTRFGLRGSVLQWFSSYLSSRKQFVRIDGSDSTMKILERGVPQGSVLGPLLYSLYTSPLGDIARQHNLNCHFFADDSQLYISFETNNLDALNCSKSTVESCVSDINKWMSMNKLKLNQGKTELLLLHSKYRPCPPLESIQIGDKQIFCSNSARNLGITFDNQLNMDDHIRKVCKSSYIQLRNLSAIKKYLTNECMEIIVHAFITSRLDHCNSLFYGLPQHLIQKLQYIQNTAARLLTHTRKYDHITPVLIKLHWLPIHYRIQYKILLLVFKALNGLAPPYITDLLEFKTSRHNLRSTSKELLNQPKSRLKTFGDRSFKVVAPKLWNILPFGIRKSSSVDIFKRSLKTHLFKQFIHDSAFK